LVNANLVSISLKIKLRSSGLDRIVGFKNSMQASLTS